MDRSSQYHSADVSELAQTEFSEVKLLLEGYTITTRKAALGRIADQYVMRSGKGQRLTFPIGTSIDSLTRAWSRFRNLSESESGNPMEGPIALASPSETVGPTKSDFDRFPSGEPILRPAPATQPGRPGGIGQHVLVVDDSADTLVAVGAFLLSAGYVVVSAADGDTAIRLIASDPQIGILVTDYVMSGLSGVELIIQGLQIRPDLKALLITGFPSTDGLAELPSHINVLAKPFRRAALIAQVKALIGKAHPVLPEEAMELVENRPG
jgi:CheY-like chemotaxis protein